MTKNQITRATLSIALLTVCSSALADWLFKDAPIPAASIQAAGMTLELQCDRIRFTPASQDDVQDIDARRGLSLRFLNEDSTESGAFQIGRDSAAVGIPDTRNIEVFFHEDADYDFVLEQMASNATLNIAMADRDDSYGVLPLQGSQHAITSLRAHCSQQKPVSAGTMEAPEGIVYCGGGAIKRQIEFLVVEKPEDEWDARVTINGKTSRAMTSYSYFGNAKTPRNFVFALLGEDRWEMLVFREGNEDWIEFGDYRYSKCN
ncbi:MAG: hypothetical protein ABJL54_19630 [Halioglobus sp.]